MDLNNVLIASLDIALPRDAAGAPAMRDKKRLKAGYRGEVTYCPECGNKLKRYDVKAEGRRHLSSLLEKAYLQARVCCAECPDKNAASTPAVIGALGKAAGRVEGSRAATNNNVTPGKVSAQEALLCSSRSRAPPPPSSGRTESGAGRKHSTPLLHDGFYRRRLPNDLAHDSTSRNSDLAGSFGCP